MRVVLHHALRELGPAALIRFGQYRLGLDTGWIRRQTPCYGWDDRPISSWLKTGFDSDPQSYSRYRTSSAPGLFIPPVEALQERLIELLGTHSQCALSAADGIAAGSFALFGLHNVELGFPPDWHRFAPLPDGVTTAIGPRDTHWSQIDLLELPADVKLLWEINRFGWVYPLVRAYTLTGDRRYFEIFWELISSWRAENAPNKGLNWYSAQEVSIRMLALIFSLYAMRAEFSRHPQRVSTLAAMIAAHASRIPPTLPYAIAQGNNHLLVEAVGLYTVGSLFPEFRNSGRWRKTGRRWLLRSLLDQVFPDGGYIQHSMNYHRLALQAALWAARVSMLETKPLPPKSIKQIARMTIWLQRLVDPDTGAAPNFGPNDGAEILPLSSLPFDDHRPTIQAAGRLLNGKPHYTPGLLDEWSLWLGVLDRDGLGSDNQIEDTSPLSMSASGFYTISGEKSRGFLRAAHFETRPGHADQLHLDLWFGSFNIALDAGTYLYNAAPPWDNQLSDAAHHNTVLVDGSDAMIRAGRFLWLNWNQARLVGRWRSQDSSLEVIVVERTGDRAGEVMHRRTVIRVGDRYWKISDDLIGSDAHRADLTWLLPDLPWRFEAGSLHLGTPVGAVILTIECDQGVQRLYRAGKCLVGGTPEGSSETMGWYSPTYALKIPALQAVVSCESKLPFRVQSDWTWGEEKAFAIDVGWNTISDQLLPLQWVKHNDAYLELNDAYSIDPSSIRRTG